MYQYVFGGIIITIIASLTANIQKLFNCFTDCPMQVYAPNGDSICYFMPLGNGTATFDNGQKFCERYAINSNIAMLDSQEKTDFLLASPIFQGLRWVSIIKTFWYKIYLFISDFFILFLFEMKTCTKWGTCTQLSVIYMINFRIFACLYIHYNKLVVL